MKKSVFSLALLGLSTPLFAQQELPLNEHYSLPLDCGYQASFTPDYQENYDISNRIEDIQLRRYHERHFRSDNQFSVFQYSSILLPENVTWGETLLSKADNLGFTFSQGDDFDITSGCVNGKLTADITSYLHNVDHVQTTQITGYVLPPAERNANKKYGLSATVKFFKHEVDDTTEDSSSSAYLLGTCPAAPEIRHVTRMPEVESGDNQISISSEQLDVTACEGELYLWAIFNGAGYRFDEFTILYSER